MNEWGLPISKDKIIARRNRLIEYQKLGELRFTPLYEAIDENILDINYMLHEIDNLQSKIYKINLFKLYLQERLLKHKDEIERGINEFDERDECENILNEFINFFKE